MNTTIISIFTAIISLIIALVAIIVNYLNGKQQLNFSYKKLLGEEYLKKKLEITSNLVALSNDVFCELIQFKKMIELMLNFHQQDKGKVWADISLSFPNAEDSIKMLKANINGISLGDSIVHKYLNEFKEKEAAVNNFIRKNELFLPVHSIQYALFNAPAKLLLADQEQLFQFYYEVNLESLWEQTLSYFKATVLNPDELSLDAFSASKA